MECPIFLAARFPDLPEHEWDELIQLLQPNLLSYRSRVMASRMCHATHPLVLMSPQYSLHFRNAVCHPAWSAHTDQVHYGTHVKVLAQCYHQSPS